MNTYACIREAERIKGNTESNWRAATAAAAAAVPNAVRVENYTISYDF